MYELVEYLICRLGLQMLVSNVYICLVDAWLDFELIRVSNGKEKKFGKGKGQIRPDSDVSSTVHRGFDFRFFLFCDFDLFARVGKLRSALDRR